MCVCVCILECLFSCIAGDISSNFDFLDEIQLDVFMHFPLVLKVFVHRPMLILLPGLNHRLNLHLESFSHFDSILLLFII